MDPADVRRKTHPANPAIMAVHLYGHPCEMERAAALAKEHDLFLIEDCAESFGAATTKGTSRAFGDIGTFSFFGNKTITTGEGGMVVTDDETFRRGANSRARASRRTANTGTTWSATTTA